MKIFFDTNVVVSAILTEGHSFDVIKDALLRHEIYYSNHVLADMERIFSTKFPLSKSTRLEVVAVIKKYFQKAAGATAAVRVCRDADDNQILADAVAGGADILVTGDKDLLVLRHQKGIRIVQPKEYWNLKG